MLESQGTKTDAGRCSSLPLLPLLLMLCLPNACPHVRTHPDVDLEDGVDELGLEEARPPRDGRGDEGLVVIWFGGGGGW